MATLGQNKEYFQTGKIVFSTAQRVFLGCNVIHNTSKIISHVSVSWIKYIPYIHFEAKFK